MAEPERPNHNQSAPGKVDRPPKTCGHKDTRESERKEAKATKLRVHLLHTSCYSFYLIFDFYLPCLSSFRPRCRRAKSPSALSSRLKNSSTSSLVTPIAHAAVR